jgi:hypothetical protein
MAERGGPGLGDEPDWAESAEPEIRLDTQTTG